MNTTSHDLTPWQHPHHFLDRRDQQRQRRTQWVVGLTFVTMLAEIACGYLTGSMALLADGWHMSTHAAALGLTVFAYRYARLHSGNARFTFGTGKVGALGGYTSALLLALVAALMIGESISRLYRPIAIAYGEALGVTIVGLLVNAVSAWLLHEHEGGHDRRHSRAHGRQHDEHEHAEHEGERGGRDHNLQGAFLHVIADLMTSVLAVVALLGGQYLGWAKLDPLMGIVGAIVILVWARGLLKDTSRTLLDAEEHEELARKITAAIESLPDHKVVDLHIWRLSATAQGCIVSIVSHHPQAIPTYKSLIAAFPGIGHVTVEVNQCACEQAL
ncbi:MAG: CDF family Co(II)/Ni(II) efflux transporter DmeF [Zoogloeaceae bacterium]|jgi:cation diffusion facilitator family transporter|nr:CDF family Co(II)/Ni(II) efflux transporter DmeF [Zoogloeaceae bacterium]